MKARRKPTSVMLNERNNLAAELYRACADGRIKDIKKIKTKFVQACISYNERAEEDERIRQEKELRKQKRLKRVKP